MRIIRFITGKLLLFLNWLTLPKKGERSEENLKKIEKELSALSIYEFKACPFCVKVRRALQKINLPVELRDAKNNSEHRSALQSEGGKIQVPCLRIQTSDGADQWMYESSDIIKYLNERFPI